VSLQRYAKEDFTFSNGLKIPKGNFISVSSYSVHMNEKNYEDPSEFKPWRFVNNNEGQGDDNRNQYVVTSPEFLEFGYGKHSWYVILNLSI
jgi:cytochrome P450